MTADKNKIHCTNCKKIIAEGSLADGKILIKCAKCGTVNTIEAATKETSRVIVNGHHSGITLGTFSIQHISEENP